jgi:hypothetical protein
MPEEKTNPSYSPFGTSWPGAIDALTKEVPSREELTDERLNYFTNIVLQTLDNQIADRNMNLVISKTADVAGRARDALLVQGLRLLVLDRIIRARDAQPLPRMTKWVAIVRTSSNVVDKLRSAGLAIP